MPNSLGIISPVSNTEKVLFTIWKCLPLTKVFLTENQVLGWSDEHRAFAYKKGCFVGETWTSISKEQKVKRPCKRDA